MASEEITSLKMEKDVEDIEEEAEVVKAISQELLLLKEKKKSLKAEKDVEDTEEEAEVNKCIDQKLLLLKENKKSLKVEKLKMFNTTLDILEESTDLREIIENHIIHMIDMMEQAEATKSRKMDSEKEIGDPRKWFTKRKVMQNQNTHLNKNKKRKKSQSLLRKKLKKR